MKEGFSYIYRLVFKVKTLLVVKTFSDDRMNVLIIG